MTKTRIGVAVALFAALTLGLWQTASADNEKENKVKSSNLVNVYSCSQSGDDIHITLKKNWPSVTLKAGCRDAGYGQRDYAFACVSDKKYKVEWEACPLVPRITQLQVKNSATGVVLSSANSSYISLGNKFAAKQTVTVASTVSALQLSLLTKNLVSGGNYTYAFAWTDASSTVNFDQSLAKSLSTGANFGSTSSSNLLLTDYYRGRDITVVAFMRNNDGVSKVPGMSVEVDDVIAIHIRAKAKPAVPTCENISGTDGAYTLCLDKTFTYSASNLTVTYAAQYLNHVGLTLNGMQFVLAQGQSLPMLAADKKTVMTVRVQEINKVTNTIRIRVITQSLLPALL